MLENARENRVTALAICISERRAGRNCAAYMIEPRLMAFERGHNITQRACARELAEKQRDELLMCRQLTDQSVAGVLGHKLIKLSPGDEFQKIVEDSIHVTHGVDPFSCPDESPNPLA
jgi:hypothetical protein